MLSGATVAGVSPSSPLKRKDDVSGISRRDCQPREMLCHFTPGSNCFQWPEINLSQCWISHSRQMLLRLAGRWRRGTDGTPAASAVTEPSQNGNYDQVAVIGRPAQGSPAISSLIQIQMWQELPTKFANLYLGVIPCCLF